MGFLRVNHTLSCSDTSLGLKTVYWWGENVLTKARSRSELNFSILNIIFNESRHFLNPKSNNEMYCQGASASHRCTCQGCNYCFRRRIGTDSRASVNPCLFHNLKGVSCHCTVTAVKGVNVKRFFRVIAVIA